MDKARELFDKAFSSPRRRRSQAYKEGVMSALISRARGRKIFCWYQAGTAAFDAFRAGLDEGHKLWSENQKEDACNPPRI